MICCITSTVAAKGRGRERERERGRRRVRGPARNINHFKQRVQRRDSGRNDDGEGGSEEDDGEDRSKAEEGRSESDEEIEIEHVRYSFTLTTILLLTAGVFLLSLLTVSRPRSGDCGGASRAQRW